MDWQIFYERFFDWASSTQIQRVRQLTSFGPSNQVTEVAQELMDEKSASRFIRKALEVGVSFMAENIEDLWSVCDKRPSTPYWKNPGSISLRSSWKISGEWLMMM